MMEKIEILKTYIEGISFKEAIKLAKAKEIELLSNQEVDAILQDDAEYNKYETVFPCWVGTLLIYEKPNTPFGKYVSFCDWKIQIPRKYQGKMNCALKIEHSDYSFEGDVFKIKPKAKITLIEDFAKNDGWYFTTGGIPCGDKTESDNKKARYLWRQDNSAWVGPLARRVFGLWVVDGGWRDVGAFGWPDVALGVVGKAKSSKKIVEATNIEQTKCQMCDYLVSQTAQALQNSLKRVLSETELDPTTVAYRLELKDEWCMKDLLILDRKEFEKKLAKYLPQPTNIKLSNHEYINKPEGER